jgi:hypothetical protein
LRKGSRPSRTISWASPSPKSRLHSRAAQRVMCNRNDHGPVFALITRFSLVGSESALAPTLRILLNLGGGILRWSGSPQQRWPTQRADRAKRALTGGNHEAYRHHGRHHRDARCYCNDRQRDGSDDPATSLVAMPQNRQCHRTPNAKQRRPSNGANEGVPGANGLPARLIGLVFQLSPQRRSIGRRRRIGRIPRVRTAASSVAPHRRQALFK